MNQKWMGHPDPDVRQVAQLCTKKGVEISAVIDAGRGYIFSTAPRNKNELQKIVNQVFK